MKFLFLFILNLIICLSALAQQHYASYYELESLPKTGYVALDSGWKFHAGDSSSWAAPSYPDNDWQLIDPTKSIHLLPELRDAQIGWLRLAIRVGPMLQDKSLTLGIWQVGASEVYLNGTLLERFGTVSTDPDKEVTHIPYLEPLVFHFSNQPVQVVAVRYSFTKGNALPAQLAYAFNPSLSFPSSFWKEALYPQVRVATIWSFASGLCLIMFILHLFLYIAYRDRRVNLYLSLFTFFQFVFSSSINLFPYFNQTATAAFIMELAYTIAFSLSWVFYLLAVYGLFHQKRGLWFKVLVLLALSTIPVYYAMPLPFSNVYGYSLIALVSGRVLLVSIRALRSRLIGAKIFLAGQIIFIFFTILLTLVSRYNLATGVLAQYLTLTSAFFLLVTLPVCLSIVLAWEVAQTNRSLGQQLKEVKRLSEKTRAQEQEKQQLLANQNELLEQQVTQRTTALNHSLAELKSTQAQLIQSEKMASLGELTAGIAHEIQNPLNFVNNFSEVNTELLDDLEQEANKGNLNEVKSIAKDLKDNSEKINHHGKRADAIVKGMLQHSRKSEGKKELTDINALCDEYLRLAYHGFKAKEKNINIDTQRDFDVTIGKVNIVRQDIGRVLLNLFNNAFYAVNERLRSFDKLRMNLAQPDSHYQPIAKVSTRKLNDTIEIRVEDNGNGIPQNIIDKIFQPFFTTKPTGQGTGLGLSLSYDIIKTHGGEIDVQTTEGQGSTFVVDLPLT